MTMSQRYTIGELAKQVGVPTSTVRYYERRGLLLPGDRSGSNYRLYDQIALERLQFMRAAQAAGFTLTDISALLEFKEGDFPPSKEVQALISERLEKIAEQLRHFKRAQKVLKSWLVVCHEAERTGRCGVIEGLTPACRDRVQKLDKRRSGKSQHSSKGALPCTMVQGR